MTDAGVNEAKIVLYGWIMNCNLQIQWQKKLFMKDWYKNKFSLNEEKEGNGFEILMLITEKQNNNSGYI